MDWSLSLRQAREYVRHAGGRQLVRTVSRLVYSEGIEVGCRKDLQDDPPVVEDPRQPHIHPAALVDLHELLDTNPSESIDAIERWRRRSLRNVVDKLGAEGCFVADVEGEGPSFMQYLFTVEDNERLQTAYPGMFPVLAADQALVEHLYVSPRSRNSALAFDCVVQVYDEARRRHAETVITFVTPTNTGAMYLSHVTGFRAYAVRRRRMRFFQKKYTFEPWPTGLSDSLLEVATGSTIVS